MLLIADSCNPEWESIPLVGWSHYQALTAHADIHLVTRNWNRAALGRAGLVEGRDFTCIDTDALFDPMQNFVRWLSGPDKGYAMLTGLSMPSYVMFEWLLWRRFGAALRTGGYDLVHRLTPLTASLPSAVAARCARLGVPFVLGPLNGALPWPKQFPGLKRQEGEFLTRLRALHRVVPGYRATRDAARAIMVGGRSAHDDLPPRWRGKAVYVPENGIDPARFPRPPARTADSYRGRPLRAVFLGRLVPYKGADMVIEAAAPFLRDGTLTLDIIGDGPEMQHLAAMADGLAGAVTFAGKLPHGALAARMQPADLLTFPSVHEFGGAVVLEGMAAGIVPVVVDYGGPAELVSSASGYLVPMGERDAIVAGLRAVLAAVIADPGQLAPRSATAIGRAFGLFTWPAKAGQTADVYRWVLGEGGKPGWGMPFADPDAAAA